MPTRRVTTTSKGLGQDLGQRRQQAPLVVPGLADRLAGRGAEAASGSLLLFAVRRVLQLGERQPVLTARVGAAVRQDAALDLALGLRRARRARVDVEAQRLREAAVRRVDLAPGAGATRDRGLLVVDPLVAATPPSRWNASTWHCC
jgi:hypothetical protein